MATLAGGHPRIKIIGIAWTSRTRNSPCPRAGRAYIGASAGRTAVSAAWAGLVDSIVKVAIHARTESRSDVHLPEHGAVASQAGS